MTQFAICYIYLGAHYGDRQTPSDARSAPPLYELGAAPEKTFDRLLREHPEGFSKTVQCPGYEPVGVDFVTAAQTAGVATWNRDGKLTASTILYTGLDAKREIEAVDQVLIEKGIPVQEQLWESITEKPPPIMWLAYYTPQSLRDPTISTMAGALAGSFFGQLGQSSFGPPPPDTILDADVLYYMQAFDILRSQIRNTIVLPAQKEILSVRGSDRSLHLLAANTPFKKTRTPILVIGYFEEDKKNTFRIKMVLRVPPAIASDARSMPTPTEVLRAMAQRYGREIILGGKSAKFFLSETIPRLPGTPNLPPGQVVFGDRHGKDLLVMTFMGAGDELQAECALLFALDVKEIRRALEL